MPNWKDWLPLSLIAVKLVILAAYAAYLVFSVIFWQKVRLLSKIIETQVSPLIVLAAFLNFVASLALLVAAIFLI